MAVQFLVISVFSFFQLLAKLIGCSLVSNIKCIGAVVLVGRDSPCRAVEGVSADFPQRKRLPFVICYENKPVLLQF